MTQSLLKRLTHKKARKRVLIFACVFLILGAAVTARSLRDFHLHDIALQNQQAAFLRQKNLRDPMFYIDDNVDISLLPAHKAEITIHAGDYKAGDGGKAAFSPSGVTVADLGDNEVNLLVTIDRIPADTAKIADNILALARGWRAENDDIGEIIIDNRPEKADLPGLARLAAQLRKASRRDYAVGIFLRRSWIEEDEKALRQIGNISKNARTFYFDAREAQKEGERAFDAVAVLDNKMKAPFVFRTATAADAEMLQRDVVGRAQFFIAALIDMSPQKDTP